MADLTFRFGSSGADRLKGDMRGVSDNAVLAAKGARLLADSLERERKAAATSAGATLALAKADKILEEAEHGLAEGALEAEFALKREAAAAKQAGVDAAAARAGFSGLAGAGGIPGGGMGAAIAAGVALSPVIATLGVGLGGLGLAALSVSKNQAVMRQTLAPLKADYAAFTKALQPEVLGIFNSGIKLAGGLLHDIQPVAAATGKAFDGFLGTIDAEFRSQTWQQLFGLMAKEAGPDMQLVSNAILPLLDTLPKLLTDIQPIAVQFLQAAAGAARLGDAAVTLNEKIQHLGTQAGHSSGFMGRLADAGKKAVGQLLPGIPAAQALGKWLGVVGGNSDKAGKSTAGAGDAFKGAWPKAQSYAQWVQASAKATTALANAQSAAVSTQLAYGNDILTSANDAQTFHDKLKASAGQIGLHTQAQRDSFGAANTYIGDLARQATTAVQSGHGTDAAITAIRNGLPALDSAKTKNKQYWQEVRTLVGYLDKLSLIKAIHEAIHVSGTGVWSVTPGKIGLPGGSAGGPFASGGQVTGGTPGRDSVLIRAMPGEVVVPTNMVRAGAVDHLRGQLPGFATGGVVGSYGPGAVSGLPRWTAMETNATVSAVARSTAASMIAGIKAAQAAAAGGGGAGGVPGPGGGAPAANAALARRMMPAWGSGAEWNAWNTLMMHESGWSQFARNPSSGAYGIPQALPPGKMGAAANPPQSNPAAQISWMIGYIRSVYGDPIRAWAQYYAHPGGVGWYAKGGLVPGYASGGTVGQQGAAWLKAWQTRHGGGFGAAWGPTVLNQQIPEMAAAVRRAKALSGASGLSPGQHRFWAAAAADETRRLAVLHKELATERAWRTQLGINELGLDRQIRAAGNLPSLAGPVRGWKAQLGRDKARVAAISRMLGYSDAYIKAHPAPKPGPVLPKITHTYGGDVANNLGVVLAAALGPFTGAARGGMVADRGTTLAPGLNLRWNGTGRPEPLVPARSGGGTIRLEVTSGGNSEFEQFMTTAIRKWVRVKGGGGPGSVERAFGAR